MDPDKLRRLHDGSETHLRPAGLPEPVTRDTILMDFSKALTALDDHQVRLAGSAVSLQDPRDIAGHILALAGTLKDFADRGWETEVTSRSLGAQVVAYILACARVEHDSPHTGDEAA